MKHVQAMKTQCAIVLLLMLCAEVSNGLNITGLLINRQPRLHHGYYYDYSNVNKNNVEQNVDLVSDKNEDSATNSVTLKKITSSAVTTVNHPDYNDDSNYQG